jgi:hypothetical protein
MKLNPEYELGDVVTVCAQSQHPALPFGLTPGFQVRVVRWGEGFLIVEREGREWRLPEANVAARPLRRPTALPATLPARRCRC